MDESGKRPCLSLSVLAAAERPVGGHRPEHRQGPEDRDSPSFPKPAPSAARRHQQEPRTTEDIFEAAANAFREGWKLLKLYFMIGLPTETEEDLAAIVALVGRAVGARPGDPRLAAPDPHERLLVHPQAAHAFPMAGHGRSAETLCEKQAIPEAQVEEEAVTSKSRIIPSRIPSSRPFFRGATAA